MAWTTPANFTALTPLLAAQLNVMQDNLRYLFDRPMVSSAWTGTHFSTTSTSFVDVTNLSSLSLTTTGGDIMVAFTNGNVVGWGGTYIAALDVSLNGTQVGDATWGLMTAGAPSGGGGTADLPRAISMMYRITSVAAGSHTLKLQMRTSAGESRLNPTWILNAAKPQFIAWEV